MPSLSDKMYKKNIKLNYFYKLIGIILSLISTRLTIAYLGNSMYGLWATIASIISWMGSGDFGIGNGLRNKYAEAFSEENEYKQKRILATGIVSLSVVAVILFVIVICITEVLVKTQFIEEIVRIPMYVTGLFFCINMVLGIAQSVAYGIQKSWKVSLINSFSSFLIVCTVFILEQIKVNSNLTTFSIAHGMCLVIPNIALIINLNKDGIHLFKNNIKNNYSKELKRDIVNAGVIFFGIQMCNIILYSTDNLIINYLMGSEMVTKYSVITKIFDTGQGLFSIMLIALWSAVTFHATRGDYLWIKKRILRMTVIWSIYVLGVIGVSFLLNPIVRIWIGENAYYYEPGLIVLFAVYACAISFSAIFVNVVNGLQKIKVQFVVVTIGAVINIPLSVIFAKYCGMGIFGVKLATLIAVLLLDVVMPIQTFRLLNRKYYPNSSDTPKNKVPVTRK